MLRNYFKIAFRNLLKHKGYSFINIFGLATGMAVAMLIGFWVWDELSINKNHKNYDRIAQVWQFVNFDGTISSYNSVPIPMAEELRSHYPDFQATSLSTYTRDQILDYQWLSENSKTSLQSANSVVLTQSWAERYFGKSNPIGLTIELNQTTYVIVTGMIADPTSPTDVNC